MQIEDRTGRYPVITERRGSITTHAHASILPRKATFAAAAAMLPLGVGALVGRRRPLAGIVAGGLTALAMAGLRWQLQRLFTDEPEYTVESRIGKLEIRKIRARVEARTQIDNADWDTARERGFDILASYIFGGNTEHEQLGMLAPVTMARSYGGQEMGFAMPIGRTVMSLPRPDEGNVVLREVPERRVAVLTFRGNYKGSNIEAKERELRTLAAKAGLTAFGPVTFAGFDPPSTLPFLKRTELWLEIE